MFELLITNRQPLTPDTTSVPTTATVHVKLAHGSEVWFALLTNRGIMGRITRFHCVITSLSPEFAMEVRDLLLKSHAENPYDMLNT